MFKNVIADLSHYDRYRGKLQLGFALFVCAVGVVVVVVFISLRVKAAEHFSVSQLLEFLSTRIFSLSLYSTFKWAYLSF